MNETNKIQILIELEPIISFNVKRIFNYRKKDYEDLMQDARMIVYNSLDKYSEDKGSLSTFCQILIKNNLVSLTTSQYRNWDKIDINSEYVDKAADTIEDSIKAAYYRMNRILEFYESRFTKAELRFGKLLLEGKSFKEIEYILGINTNHRVQLAYRFKNKVKYILEEEE